MKHLSKVLNQGMHDFNRVETFTVKNQIINGEFIQAGVGESSNLILFPVRFIEKPHFSFGGELTVDSSPTDTFFPTISVVVLSWEIEQPEMITDQNALKRYYVGATLGVVTSGVAEKMNVHWRFEGKGIVNPALSEAGTSSSGLKETI
jgi:hypothetical protein